MNLSTMFKIASLRLACLILLLLSPWLWSAEAFSPPYRIAVVSSYHPEYTWSQATNQGLLAGLTDLGLLESPEEAETFTKNDQLSGKQLHMRKYWMDTKRKSSPEQIAESLDEVTAQLKAFDPHILLLGDDNATNYLGNYYLDTDLPVIFWGVNGTPVKYGLLQSADKPGHNVTGIYQANYHTDTINLLRELSPTIKNVAILSDDSTTGRSHAKAFQKALIEDHPALNLSGIVMTSDYTDWKMQVLKLHDKIDAFLVSSVYALKESDQLVKHQEVIRWYLMNTNKPEAVAQVNLVKDGLMAAVFDSPQKQGIETARMVGRLIFKGEKPAEMAAYAPAHGGYILNQWRADLFGIQIKDNKFDFEVHEVFDTHVSIK